jgi:hypothetical protein
MAEKRALFSGREGVQSAVTIVRSFRGTIRLGLL